MVFKQAALTASAGNSVISSDEFSGSAHTRQATFTNLEAAVRDVVPRSGSAGIRQMAMDLARSSGRPMQQAITKPSVTFDILTRVVSSRRYPSAGPTPCAHRPRGGAVGKHRHESCAKLADAGRAARADSMSPSATSGVRYRMPWTVLEVSWRRYENRPQALRLPCRRSTIAETSRLAPRACHRLQKYAGVNPPTPLGSLTDEATRAVLDYLSRKRRTRVYSSPAAREQRWGATMAPTRSRDRDCGGREPTGTLRPTPLLI